MADAKIIVKVEGDTKQLDKRIKSSEKSIKLFKASATAAAAGFGLLAAGIGAAVNEARKIEDITVQFEVLTGSAREATKIVKDLQNFSATTPFQFEGIAKAAQQLLGFGFQAEEIVPKLQQIGDVASAIGKPIDEVAFIFGQVAAAGKLTGERLLQFQERAIPIGPAIAKTMGIAQSAVKDAVSAGKVDLETFQKAFASLSAEGGFAFEGMIKQSKTFSGLMSTVADNVKILAAQIGTELLPVAKQLAISFLNGLTALRDMLKVDDDEAAQKVKQLNEELLKTDAKIKELRESLAGESNFLNNLVPDEFLNERLVIFMEKRNEILAEQALLEQENVALQNEEKAAAEKKHLADIEKLKEQATKELIKKRKAIEKKELTEQQKFDLAKLKLQKQYTDASLSLATNLQDLSIALTGKSNKALFLLEKSASIAQAIVATNLGAAKALALGPPHGPILAGITTAAGYAKVATIAATTIQGFQDGGLVTGGIPGRDSVPAALQAGELVVPRQSFDDVIASERARREAEALTEEGAASSSVEVELSFKDDVGDMIEAVVLQRRTLGIGAI